MGRVRHDVNALWFLYDCHRGSVWWSVIQYWVPGSQCLEAGLWQYHNRSATMSIEFKREAHVHQNHGNSRFLAYIRSLQARLTFAELSFSNLSHVPRQIISMVYLHYSLFSISLGSFMTTLSLLTFDCHLLFYLFAVLLLLWSNVLAIDFKPRDVVTV